MLIVIATSLLLMLVAGLAFNHLVTARNEVQNAFAQIDVQLTRRYDLIPNLVESAKGYLAHERGTLEAVTAARAAALTGLAGARAQPGDATAVAALSAADGALNGSLAKFLSVAENYPELKGNETMAALTEALSSTENRIAFARQAYNDAVMVFNNVRDVFPTVVVAAVFGFSRAASLAIESEARRAAPSVKFTAP